MPTYFVSAIEDHIAPWKTTYAGPQLMRGKSRFVLSGSGHIAGMINPPAANKYGYWTNDELPDAPDEWFAGAKQHDGSWWTDWRAVARRRTSARRFRRACPARASSRCIEAAPGSYARVRADPT